MNEASVTVQRRIVDVADQGVGSLTLRLLVRACIRRHLFGDAQTFAPASVRAGTRLAVPSTHSGNESRLSGRARRPRGA